MAGIFGRRTKGGGEARTPKAVLAAAMPLAGPDVRRVQGARLAQTVEGWQKDAWYFYDSIGELRAPVNWIANAVSKAAPFAAETDPETGLVTGPTEDATVQRAASLLLGGAAQRAQLQYILAVCWQIPGEAFVVIRPRSPRNGVQQPDEWLVLAGDRVEVKGGSWQYMDPRTLLTVSLGARDRLIRVWSPHPRDQAKADTAVRPALPILREIERSSMNIAARLDSRLAGNGILPIPQEMNFPLGDHESMSASFSAYLMDTMEASMRNPGTASAQVPIIAEMPIEMIQQWKDSHMDLATEFDSTIVDLRNNGIERLAATLDMPKSVAQGTQADSNHWSAWQVQEDAYKIYMEPLLQRIGDALTEYWFQPVLAAMGVQNPERYVIDWDISEIVTRPDSQEDINWLYEHELISDDARRAASGIPDDAIPTDEELQIRRLVDIVKGAPTLAADPQVSEALFGLIIAPAAAGVAETAIEADPGSGTAPALPAATPETQDAAQQNDVALAAAATFVVFDALSLAGGRLLTREHRGQFGHVDKHALYLSIPYDTTQVPKLMEGSFQSLDGLADGFGIDRARFSKALTTYVRYLLATKEEHNPDTLRATLKAASRP